MGRKNVRLVTTQVTDVFTSGERVVEVDIPVFSLDFPEPGLESSPWIPTSPYIQLTGWYIQAGVKGSAPSIFQILVGDNLFYPNGGGEMVARMGLATTESKVSQSFLNSIYPPPVVSNRQWIKIFCEGGSHENLLIKVYGKRM